ncbi:uncharacterized protein B0H64DRAFT_466443 [Chaetomium fimeti]|uniref:Uncharacterized protein n=1 Tax=Chaetomium fimeti TaxID=1854472 RepID=A0AAE0HBZ2_9PEZI|nr:hypothetical protein B0H64DRAFT_466443 [Chaetomium fimeti]
MAPRPSYSAVAKGTAPAATLSPIPQTAKGTVPVAPVSLGLPVAKGTVPVAPVSLGLPIASIAPVLAGPSRAKGIPPDQSDQLDPSTPISPDRAHSRDKIIENLEAMQKGGHLNAETSTDVDQLLQKAREPSTDTDLLAMTVSELQKNQKLAAECEKLRSELHEMKFSLYMGDWISDIVNAVRAAERDMIEAKRNRRRGELRARGCSNSEIEKGLKGYAVWGVLSSFSAEESCTAIDTVLDEIKKWMARGPAAKNQPAPATPACDRLQSASADAGVDHKLSIQSFRLSRERNSLAHHSPPRLEKHLNEDKTRIDCRRLQNACKERKDELKGLLTKERFDVWERVIDGLFSLHVKRKKNGVLAQTAYAAKRIGEIKQGITTKEKREGAPKPDSTYEEGKWDDVLHTVLYALVELSAIDQETGTERGPGVAMVPIHIAVLNFGKYAAITTELVPFPCRRNTYPSSKIVIDEPQMLSPLKATTSSHDCAHAPRAFPHTITEIAVERNMIRAIFEALFTIAEGEIPKKSNVFPLDCLGVKRLKEEEIRFCIRHATLPLAIRKKPRSIREIRIFPALLFTRNCVHLLARFG